MKYGWIRLLEDIQVQQREAAKVNSIIEKKKLQFSIINFNSFELKPQPSKDETDK